MGTSLSWILVREDAEDGEFPASLPGGWFRTYGTFGGWFAGELKRPRRGSTGKGPPDTDEQLADVIASIAGERRAPALGAHVFDSDYLYLIAASPDGELCHVVNDVDIAADSDGAWAAARYAEQAGGRDPQVVAAERLARWSALAPRAADPSDLRELLFAERTFAEEGLLALLKALGLPHAPDVHPRFKEALSIRDYGKDFSLGYEIENASARFVEGYGQDFHGIWDRERGGPPIERFPLGEIGGEKARKHRLGLLFPPPSWCSEAVVVWNQEGRVEEDDRDPQRISDLRYAFGMTRAAWAIWDRERPGPPVETFEDIRRGYWTALPRWLELNGLQPGHSK